MKFSPRASMQASFVAILSLLMIFQPFGTVLNAAPDPSPPKDLQITILDGEGALNNIRDRTAREPIVQVTDENHKPVSEAAVLFLINEGDNGAGATVGASQGTTFATTTDFAGQAKAVGFQANKTSGAFTVSVIVTYAGLRKETLIHMSNVDAPVFKFHGKTINPGTASLLTKVVLITVVAGAGVGLAAGAGAFGGTGSTSITTGPGNVGPPAAGIRIRLGH